MSELARTDEAVDYETGEVLTSNAPVYLPAVERAEIDMQIATARQYPRSMKDVRSRIYGLVTLDEESAEECIYALPRGGKPIKGPSIRFAEALKTSYGNCRAAARVVDVNRVEKYVEAEGVFFDLETNTATSARVRRRIVDKRGNLYNDDMILVTGNAACSIALRNAILGGVPKPLWRAAYDAANRVVSGDVTTLAVNREKALKALAVFGVKPEQIFAALGIKGAEDITVDHIGILRGMYSALKNAESTVEEMFAAPMVEKKIDAENNPLVDKPKSQGAGDTIDWNDAKKAADALNVGLLPDGCSSPHPGVLVVPDGFADGQPTRGSSVIFARFAEVRTVSGNVLKTKVQHAPDLVRAGAQAAIDDEERKAPEDMSPADCAAWLSGYDTVAAGRAGGAQ